MPHGRLRIEAENKRVIAIAANDRVDAADAVVSTLRDGVITVSEVEGAYAPPRPGGDRDVVIARTRRAIAVAGDSEAGGELAGIEAGTVADTANPARDILDADGFRLFVALHHPHAFGIHTLDH